MTVLRQLHRWLGLGLALVVAGVAGSGGLLLLRDPYYRFVHPRLAEPIAAAEIAARAEILTHIESRWKSEGVELVKFPRPGLNAYHVWLRDGTEAFVDSATGGVLDRWHWRERPPAFLFELHAHLFAGRPGTVVNGIAALFVLFMTLTGFALWWPARNGAFRLRGAFPRTVTPPDVLRSHAAVGALAALPAAVFVGTGALMAFYTPTARLMSRMFDRQVAAEPNARVAPQHRPPLAWSVLLAALDRTIPEGDVVYYYPGTHDNARLMFRKRLPGEWHPNGRSYILMDPYSADIVQTIDARAQGAGTRFMNTVYPVHAARVGGSLMVGVGAFAALALVWLAGGGVWTYAARRPLSARRQPRSGVLSVEHGSSIGGWS